MKKGCRSALLLDCCFRCYNETMISQFSNYLLEMTESNHLNLVPPLFEEGQAKEFVGSGQTVSFACSPRSNTLAVFASPSRVSGYT